MEKSEKEFIKKMMEAGIKLPNPKDVKKEKIDFEEQPLFIKDLVTTLENKEQFELSLKSFESSLKIENYLRPELIKKFIAPNLIETNLFAGRNVSDYSWFPANQKLKDFLAKKIDVVDDCISIQINTSTNVEFKLLSWYKNTLLVKLSDDFWSNPNLNLYYLLWDGVTLRRLNGTSPPIHEVNSSCPIKLNPYNAVPYLMFFCFFVRGEEGPFYVVEHKEDPFLPKNEDVLSVIQNVAHKVSMPILHKNTFLANVIIFYSNAIFEAQFSIQETGMIDMSGDEPIADSLPASVQRPIALLKMHNDSKH